MRNKMMNIKKGLTTFLTTLVIISMIASIASATSWPMLGHDAGHTGSTDSAAPSEVNVFLESLLKIDNTASGLLYVDGALVVSTIEDDTYGRLLKANAYTGEIIWETDYMQLGKTAPYPAYDYGKLYLTITSNVNEGLLCFDAETGEELWSFDSGMYGSSPTVYNGNVYVTGDISETLYCVDDQGEEVWSYDETEYKYKGVPTAYNNKVYIVTNQYSNSEIICFDAINGDVIWTYEISETVDKTLVVDNDKVFVSARNSMYCLDAQGNGDGTTDDLWIHTFGNSYYPTTPAVTNEYVYSGAKNMMYCLDITTGDVIWEYMVHELINRKAGTPTVADDKVYFGGDYIYKAVCVDAIGNGDGTTNMIWEYELDKDLIHQPVIGDGNLWFTTKNSGIFYGIFDSLPTPEIDEAPELAFVGENCAFTTSEGILPVQYFFDWGDGEDSYWIPENPIPAGESYTGSYSYNEPGIYEVRVKARTENGIVSDWSEPSTVQIHRLNIISVSGGMGVTATIQNQGDLPKDIDWSVELIGGTIPGFHLNKHYEGTTQAVDAGENVVISTGPVFGLGNFDIKITAECAGEPPVSKTIEGRILFFYVLI